MAYNPFAADDTAVRSEYKSARETRNPLAQLVHALGLPERLVAEHVATPVAQATGGISPESAARLRALEGGPYMGDVFREARTLDFLPEGLARNAGYGALGLVTGALVDPLTYTGIGPLTRAGRAAGAMRRAPTLEKQLHYGQRDLLTFAGQTVVPGNVIPEVARPIDTVLQGRMFRSIAKARVGGAMDLAVNRSLQNFGFGVGVNPALYQTMKEFHSALIGYASRSTTNVADTLEPTIFRTRDILADATKIPKDEVERRLRGVITDVMETTNLKGPRRLTRPVGASMVPVSVVDEVLREFGMPANMGGPASIFDAKQVKDLRTTVINAKLKYEQLIQDEIANDLKVHRIVSNTDGYALHMLTDEAQKFFKNLADTTWRGGTGKARKLPAQQHASMFMRRMRNIDLEAAEAFGDSEIEDLLTDAFQKGKLPTNKALSAIGKWLDEGQKLEKAGHAGEYERRTLIAGKAVPAMTVKEANEYVRTNGLKHFKQEIPPGAIQEFFSSDPTVILAARSARADRAILSKEFFDDLKTRHNGTLLVDAKTFRANKAAYSGWTVPNVPELAGYYMHPESAMWLNRMESIHANLPKEIRSTIETYQKVLGFWKGTTLAFFPSYVSRNAIGNAWMFNFIEKNPIEQAKYLKLSGQAWDAIRNGKGDSFMIDVGGGKKISASQIWHYGQDRNLWGSGIAGGENEKTIGGTIRSVRRFGGDNPETQALRMQRRYKGWVPNTADAHRISAKLSPSPYIEAGFRVNSWFDDRFRFAAMVKNMRAGHNPYDAVLQTKKYFFDYSDLAPIEKTLLRNVFPFYAWSRKNIPVHLEALVTQPGQFARVGSGVQSFEGRDVPSEERVLSDWMVRAYPMRVRKNKNGEYEYFVLKSWLPAADLMDILQPLEWAMMSATPFAKIPLELLTNTNFQTRRDIDRLNSVASGERTKVYGQYVPNKAAHLIKSVRGANLLHQIVDNPQELDFVSQVMRVMAGRTYPLDYRRSLYHFQREFEEIDRATKRAAKSAQGKNYKAEEIQRILLAGQQKQQELLREHQYVGTSQQAKSNQVPAPNASGLRR